MAGHTRLARSVPPWRGSPVPRSRRHTPPPRHSQTPAAVGGRQACGELGARARGRGQGPGVPDRLRRDRALTSSGPGRGAGWGPGPGWAGGDTSQCPSHPPSGASGRRTHWSPSPSPLRGHQLPRGPEAACSVLVGCEENQPPRARASGVGAVSPGRQRLAQPGPP